MTTRPFMRVFARGAVRRVAYVVIAAVAAVLRRRHQNSPVESVHRILICRLDLMGDLLFARPLIQAVRDRYPHSTITLLTLPYTSPLAATFSEVDHVVTVDTNRIRTVHGLLSPATWREYILVGRRLRDQDFDLGISVCGRMASLCVSLAGTKRSVGYAGEAYPFVLDDVAPGGRYALRKHEVEYVRTLAAFAGANSSPDSLELSVTDESVSSVAGRLRRLGVHAGDPLVLIHAGAVNGSAKRWPTRNWALFADRVTSETGATVLLAGAASDAPLASEVIEHASTCVLTLVGQTSIPDLCALIARADLVATGDSGPLHLAVALSRPLVAVYGPTDPLIHGPFNPTGPTSILRADIPCSPCYSMAASADCPLGDPICMRLVTVDQMVDRALAVLRSNGDGLAVREDQLLMP